MSPHPSSRAPRPLWALALRVLPCLGMDMSGRPGYGLVGYGIVMYDPVCPYACRGALSASRLNCSTSMVMHGTPMVHTPAACYATDTSFLASMAWCIKPRCTHMKAWEIEQWWHREIPGKHAHQPDPKWTYQETLDARPEPPTLAVAHGDALNSTMLVSDQHYQLQATTLAAFTTVENNHSKYGLVLLISSVVIPVAASLLRFLPLPSAITSTVRARLIDQALVTPRRGLLSRFLSPHVTRGHAVFLLYLLIVNTVLCFVGNPVVVPNAWWTSRNRQVLTYVANRAGALSFANVPVLILYAGRNNFLLWLTDWEHSTFVLLHGWVALICTIQAVLHSIIYLRIYLHLGTHATESQLPYWYWGIIATLGFSLLLPGSIAAIQRKVYEIFLAAHFAIALLALVGCYLHIFYKFEHQWGYELWIYVAFAIWGFDRLARLLRMARHGLRTASITAIDDDYVRVDVPGMAGDGHAYLYFPTLTWRVWENHPFSIVTTFTHTAGASEASSDASLTSTHVVVDAAAADGDPDGKAGCVTWTPPPATEGSPGDSLASMTFFVRVCGGTTSHLRRHGRLPVLVESGYPVSHAIPPTSTLVCIAGGVGVTAAIPPLRAHGGRGKLYWSCRRRALREAVEPLLHGVDTAVVVGARHDLRRVLEVEAAGGRCEMVVLVSGPPGMMHDVRAIVCDLAPTSARPLRIVSESFSW